MNLFVFGLGYSALHLIARHGPRLGMVAGTVTSAEKAALLADRGVAASAFDAARDTELPAAARENLRRADALLVSVPPAGDAAIAALLHGRRDCAPALATIGYFSTIGVYGDRAGGVVDCATPPAPTGARGHARLAAEERWRDVAASLGAACALFRIAGIYGPGRNALADLAAGRARRVVKPGQVFNRIHVDDIADLTMAGLARGVDAAYDLADDEPAPPQDVVAHAARLMGVEPPPETRLASAGLSPMARSFWEENKRVDNRPTKAALGAGLTHPTYREGLAALVAAGEGRGRS